MTFLKLPKLKPGDKVAILSPSFAAPGRWPHVHELGLQRLKEIFGLEPVELPTTRKLGATTEERAKDLIAAFENPEIKAVISSIGGDDQVTYVKNLPSAPFTDNPKPFFGYSDNTHFMNHLWHCGIPSYYGGALFTEFAETGCINPFTVKFLEHALFKFGMVELEASPEFSDIGLDWADPSNLTKRRRYQENEGWYWDGKQKTEGLSWGGCLESIDEMLRHAIRIPSLSQFEQIVLFVETSEEIPSPEYVYRVFRGLGERGILGRIQGLLVGRPKAWEFGREKTDEDKVAYKASQREAISASMKTYNPHIPVIQNFDFGHTSPQICLPFGSKMVIDPINRKITAEF